MRTCRIFFLTLTVIVMHVSAFQTQLQFQETSSYFNDLCFVTDQIGWAAGSSHWDTALQSYTGTIMKTDDGGETWTFQTVNIQATLKAITFIDQNNGWAVGEAGTIVHTTDGGSHWNSQAVDSDDEFAGVFFTDALNGWATSVKVTGYDWLEYPNDWQGTVWHTSDGGNHWQAQTMPENTGLLRRIDFVDNQNGWTVGTRRTRDEFDNPDHRAAVYHTSNGGQTWTEQFDQDLKISLTGVDFLDTDEGWAVGFVTNSSVQGGNVFHTTNGGQSWDRIDEGGFMVNFWDVEFLDSSKGYIVGTMYGAAWGPPVLRTMDGGQTWEMPIMEKHDGEGLYGVAVMPNRVVAIGDHDYMAVSTLPWGTADWPNGENLFSQKYIQTHYKFEDIFFYNDLLGWVVGSKSFEPSIWGQVILITTDGGKTWQEQYECEPDDVLFSVFRLDKIYFLDQKKGWAVGRSEIFLEDGFQRKGAILYTENGGLTWTEQGSDLEANELFSVQFLNANDGWAINNGGPVKLAHTSNGGQNWEWVDTPVTDPLGIGFAIVMGDLFFTDATHGWGTGGLGSVIYTENGGTTWQDRSMSGDLEFRHCLALHFLDNQYGWIAGEGLFYTNDAGLSWNEYNMENIQDFHDIQFTDDLHGWTVGDYGIILCTDNGGQSWNGQNDADIIYADLKGLSFVQDTLGWAAGDYGVVIKIKGGKTEQTFVDDKKSFKPMIFKLEQNYPNPFNASTVIRFTLPLDHQVKLAIFNILGEKVAQLYQGNLRKGHHHFIWNAGDNPSGVYICRLEAGDHVDSQRLVLEK